MPRRKFTREFKVSAVRLVNEQGYSVAEAAASYVPHIRRIGEEKWDQKKRKRRPARRGVVERTLGWLNNRRAILACYAKKSCNYLGLIPLACGLPWYRRKHRLAVLG